MPDEIKESSPIVAYRTWKFLEPYFLADVNNTTVWLPCEKLEARCAFYDSHIAPMSSCSCGIYALKDGVTHEYNQANAFVGEVYLWGRILEFEKGYRVQYAYPKSIGVCAYTKPRLNSLIEYVAWKYGVPTNKEIPELKNRVSFTRTPSYAVSPRQLTLEELIALTISPKVAMTIRKETAEKTIRRLQSAIKMDKNTCADLVSRHKKIKENIERSLRIITLINESLKQEGDKT